MQGTTIIAKGGWLGRITALGAMMTGPVLQAASEWKEPLIETLIAGFRHHHGAALWPWIRLGDELRLRREPGNRYDPSAVSVWFQGRKIGYLPRTANSRVARALDRGRRLEARVTELKAPGSPHDCLRLRVSMICRRP